MNKTSAVCFLFLVIPPALFAGTNALLPAGTAGVTLLVICCVLTAALAVILVFSMRRSAALQRENTELSAGLNMEREKTVRMDKEISVRDERTTALNARLNALEARREAEGVELRERIRELEKTRYLLEGEQKRITAEELERRREEEAKRDRMWNIHEREAIARMAEVCRKAEIQLPCFDNTNLPDDLDPSLKPDFLIRLLGQYVIFDAKVSKSQNLQVYLATQVKKTAEKLNASRDRRLIYRQVFFVVPGTELPSLRQTTWFEQGYTFFAVSLDAFEPVITAMKRLEEYEFAGRFDPQEREAIVNIIAAFEQHIRQQNAGNIIHTLRGLAVLGERASLPGDMAEEVENRRKNMRIENLKPAELKRLMDDPEYQIREIARIVRPAEPDIAPGELTEAAEEDNDERR